MAAKPLNENARQRVLDAGDVLEDPSPFWIENEEMTPMNYADLISELLELPARIAIREDAGAATKLNLEAAQSGLLLSGEITGKNAEERKAQLFLRTEELERNAAARIVELHELQNRFAALRSVARLLAPQDDRE